MFYKNILLAITSTSAFFIAFEAFLAMVGVQPLILTEDPLVGFAGNVPQFVESTQPDGSVILKTAINKRRMFNYQEFPKIKGDNSYRIFCMGGSTTYGRPYYDRVSFCGWLRAHLKAADPSRDWEVINAGGVSFASYRVARLMSELKEYQPDLFIVYTGHNEFLEQRSYGRLMKLPSWVINLDAALGSTRTYSAIKSMLQAVTHDSLEQLQDRYILAVEVDEILNHTVGPESYLRNDRLKQQIITHYRMNLKRMILLARSVDSEIIFIQPASNLKDMSPFKSDHKEGLGKQELTEWDIAYTRATLLHEAGRTNEALNGYREALEIDERHADLHYRMGQVLFELGQYEMAEEAFRRAIDEDIAPLRILSSMQQILEELTASEDVGLIDFREIIRKAYLSQYDHAIFGKEYFRDHVHTTMEGYRLLATALFDQLTARGIVKPTPSWGTAQRASVDQAVIAGLDPGIEGTAMLNLGKVFDWAGKFEEAYDAFKRALEILGPSPMLYDRLATSSLILHKYDDTVGYLRDALVMMPEMPGIHLKLAMVLGKQGKTLEAISHCRAELELNPDNYHVHTALGTLLEKTGDEDAAVHHYKLALQSKPDHEQALVKLAGLLIDLKRHNEALVHAEKALQINPEQYRAHNALGKIMMHAGKDKMARYHFSEALRLKPPETSTGEKPQPVQSLSDNAALAGNPQ